MTKVIVDDDGKPKFEVVHRTPGPIEPVMFPAWKTKAEWNEYLDGLRAVWGGAWERRP